MRTRLTIAPDPPPPLSPLLLPLHLALALQALALAALRARYRWVRRRHAHVLFEVLAVGLFEHSHAHEVRRPREGEPLAHRPPRRRIPVEEIVRPAAHAPNDDEEEWPPPLLTAPSSPLLLLRLLLLLSCACRSAAQASHGASRGRIGATTVVCMATDGQKVGELFPEHLEPLKGVRGLPPGCYG